ncbi:Hypothetical predicted protein [Marmota monax]|uniref:G-protein coupled receptors family 1 profile domain-containing protein n=1 Tax=Marmota monax TaxID=9995 RepID=A0A5E4C059_MARMO|nr:hypothetical protein GHT09_012092 [Marmota monax]VTJ74620.1 Hypothetical predicted protein [Marmota monax]
MYIRSGSGKSLEEDKVVSVFYTVVIPMLNPLIYSLRNKDVKAAFKKVTGHGGICERPCKLETHWLCGSGLFALLISQEELSHLPLGGSPSALAAEAHCVASSPHPLPT